MVYLLRPAGDVPPGENGFSAESRNRDTTGKLPTSFVNRKIVHARLLGVSWTVSRWKLPRKDVIDWGASKITRYREDIVMTDQKEPILDLETERSLNAKCLVLEMAGQTWHVPFNSLQGIPRLGEKIRFDGVSSGKDAEVENEYAPEEAAPVELAREMPAAASYARPVRIVVRLS